eukprot:1147886-Pelagomonas_calceolata.AAC.1
MHFNRRSCSSLPTFMCGASSSATVMIRSPGQARGGRQQGGEVPGSNPCGRGGDKDALYWWESMRGSFLNARGQTASIDLYLHLYHVWSRGSSRETAV